MKRLSSTRLRLAPSPPILISSSACVMSSAPVPWSAAGLSPELLGSPQHRFHDVLVARASAEVARQGPAHLVLGRVRVLLEQCSGCEHHAGGAETALQPVFLLE